MPFPTPETGRIDEAGTDVAVLSDVQRRNPATTLDVALRPLIADFASVDGSLIRVRELTQTAQKDLGRA